MKRFVFEAADEAATGKLGEALAEVLPPYSVVALDGTLGAGKTRLVQALASAAGAQPGEVVSPTFTLIQQYACEPPIYHFDAYRLHDVDEFLQLGPEEYFDAPAISLVEWAERVVEGLPPERLQIRIGLAGPTARRFEITALGQRYEPVVAELAKRLEA